MQYSQSICLPVLYKYSTENHVTEQLIMNFVWSLKPIFIWLTIFTGLDFDRSKKKKTIRRWFLRFFRILWLILYIAVNTCDIAENIVQLKCYPNSTKNVGWSKINFMNARITWISFSSLIIGFYLSILVSGLVKWKPLWKKIKLIQLELSDLTTCYRRLRRETFVGLLLISTVIQSFNTVLV